MGDNHGGQHKVKPAEVAALPAGEFHCQTNQEKKNCSGNIRFAAQSVFP
jgi:hypothetical protein